MKEEISVLRDKIKRTPQEIDETLLIFNHKLSILDDRIYKITDENKLLQIELSSLNNQLNDSLQSSKDEISQVVYDYLKIKFFIIFFYKSKKKVNILYSLIKQGKRKQFLNKRMIIQKIFLLEIQLCKKLI